MFCHLCEHIGQRLVGKGLALLGRDAADVDGAAVLAHFPYELEVVERLEEVLVVDFKLAILQPLIGNPGVLIVVAHLVGMGIESAIGSNEAVAVEVMIGSGIAPVVAAVGEDLLACDGALVAQTLIDEVPDIATLILGVLADDVPVLLEAAHGVTHRVGVLTLDERTGIVALGILHAVVVAQIHRAEDIGLAILACLLELAGARGIVSLHPVVGALEVRTVARLIAQRPHDDGGVVLIGNDVALLALDMGEGKGFVLGKGLLAIAHTVALEVRLCRQVDAILVAEVIPAGIVRIVAGAHGVDVELLHDLDILNHA